MVLAARRLDSDSGMESTPLTRLAEIIRHKSLSEGKELILASGRTSTFYFDMKATTFDPEGSNLIADLILEKISSDNVDYIGGLEMGAVPIVVGVSLRSHLVGRPIPSFFVRKKVKQHGTQKLIERDLEPGSQVLMVDDVTTTGGSVMKAVNAVRDVGCVVNKVITVVDREEGAAENLAEQGIELVPLLTASDFNVTG